MITSVPSRRYGIIPSIKSCGFYTSNTKISFHYLVLEKHCFSSFNARFQFNPYLFALVFVPTSRNKGNSSFYSVDTKHLLRMSENCPTRFTGGRDVIFRILFLATWFSLRQVRGESPYTFLNAREKCSGLL